MLDPFPRSPENTSTLGRLLEELSWGDVKFPRLRDGGRGIENVLTTEVFQALDFLPRSFFLAPLLRACHGATAACTQVASEAEQASLILLPGTAYLRPSRGNHSQAGGVQPDVLLRSPGVYGLIEVKGARASSAFQPAQLAKEYCIVRRDAGDRLPLLLVVIAREPPVLIKGQGRKQIEQAVGDDLSITLDQIEGFRPEPVEVRRVIGETLAWITWPEVRELIVRHLDELGGLPEPVARSIRRVAMSAVDAIRRHS